MPEDEPVQIRIEYYAEPKRFTQDDDFCSVPDDLLLALAVVMGKGHYRQQDVQLYADRFANMLRQAKAENFGVDGEDALGVEYKGNASTETLAALVAEHAPAV